MWSPKPDEKELERHRKRAELIFEAYKAVGAEFVAVGAEDLRLGWKTIRDMGRKAGLTLLAANLKTSGGAKPFKDSVMIERDGTKIGFFALVQPSPREKEDLSDAKLTFADLNETAKQITAKLKKNGADIVVAVLASGKKEARNILEKVPEVNLVIASGRRAWMRKPIEVGSRYVLGVPPGGKHMGVTELNIKDGSLKMESVSQRFAVRNRIERMLSSCGRYESILKRRKGRHRERYERRLESMQKSILASIEKLKELAKKSPKGSYLAHRTVLLNSKVGDDAAFKKKVAEAKKKFGLNDRRHRYRGRRRNLRAKRRGKLTPGQRRRFQNRRRGRGRRRRRGGRNIMEQGSNAMSLPPPDER
jgi:hypothetical protein